MALSKACGNSRPSRELAKPHPSTLSQALACRSKDDARGVTFIPGGRDNRFFSYGDLYRCAGLRLGALQQRGVEAGQQVVFQLGDDAEFIVMFWACILGGMIPVPLTLGFHEELRGKLTRVFRELENPLLLTDKEAVSTLARLFSGEAHQGVFALIQDRVLLVDDLAAEERPGKVRHGDPDDLAFIQYSSGSTGDPKGIMLTHTNLMTNIRAMIAGARIDDRDSTLSWMPLTHDMGLIGFHLTPLVAGINQAIMPASRFLRNPLRWLEMADWKRISIICSPNFGYRHFLNAYRRKEPQNWDLSCIRLILNGAEPISASLCREFLDALRPYGLDERALFTVYGLAEASLAVTFPPLRRGLLTVSLPARGGRRKGQREVGPFVDLGRPVRDCQVRICNEHNEAQPENTIGQVQIRGANVTSGYYRNPEATRQAVTEDGWLSTGDLGFMCEGSLVVTGRLKDVLFIRGQNYYAHDLERLVEEVEGASPGKVVVTGVFKEEAQSSQVIVFVHYRGSLEKFAPTVLAVKQRLSIQVGLDPDAVIPIHHIPRTTSGKLRRFVLERQYRQQVFSEVQAELEGILAGLKRNREVLIPTDPLQVGLAELWREVLDLDEVGCDDNFFSLGGNSLEASNLAVKIATRFHVQVSLKDLFQLQTLEEMANFIRSGDAFTLDTICHVPDRDFYPLSSEQKRLYFLHRFNRENRGYNQSQAFELQGEPDGEQLRRALNQLVAIHESLRTVFLEEEGYPVQKILPRLEVDIEVGDLAEGPLSDALHPLVRPFDLSRAPLFRIHLLRRGPARYLLFLDMHHIICDGTSLVLFMQEWFHLYGRGQLPEQVLQYRDYAVWQEKLLASERLNDARRYWLQKLEGALPNLDLPVDDIPGPGFDERGERVVLTLDGEITESLRMLSQQYQVTVSMVLLTVFKILLARYNSQEEILAGAAMAGRNHPGLDAIMGIFVKTVVLRTHIPGSQTFKGLLGSVKEQFFDIYENQDYPFEKIVEDVVRERQPGHNPLFDVSFVFQNLRMPNIQSNGLAITIQNFDPRIAKIDLTLEVEERGPALTCFFDFRAAIFQRATIARMAAFFETLVRQVGRYADLPCNQLRLQDENEARAMLSGFNGNGRGFAPDRTMPGVMEEARRVHGRRVLLRFREMTVTYAETERRANLLARELRRQGVTLETPVGLCLDRSDLLVVAILAIWKAGGAFLPIDPDLPPARQQLFLAEGGVTLVLAISGRVPMLSHPFRILSLDLLRDDSVVVPPPSGPVQPQNLAYILFTSGSTGLPKAVAVPHGQLVHSLQYLQHRVPMATGDRALAKFTVSFDASLQEMFQAPLVGASVCIAERDSEKDPHLIADLIERYRISQLFHVPSGLKLLLETVGGEGMHRLASLKSVILGGEPMSAELARMVRHWLPDRVLANLYGPTEATINAAGEILPAIPEKFDPPIGRPLPDCPIYILDHRLSVQPIGIAGEIFISGAQVARGYSDPGLTAERFLPDLFTPGGRMYRSGDMGRWLADGRIRFMGRVDHQVKVRGYRVELGEVEHYLCGHDAVADAVVVGKSVRGREQQLCAYYVPAGKTTPMALRNYLAERLPAYMVPSYLVPLEAIPRTKSGKKDLPLLPDPAAGGLIRAEYVAPANHWEAVIATIWQEALGVDQVGRDDHFFELGGHSMIAARTMTLLERETGIKLGVATLFEAPRVRELASRVEVSLAEERRDPARLGSYLAAALATDLEMVEVDIAGSVRRLWLTEASDRRIKTLLRKVNLPEYWPHYRLPAAALAALPRNGALAPDEFACLLGLRAWDEAAFMKTFSGKMPRMREILSEAIAAAQPIRTYPCSHHPKWFVERGIRSVLCGEFEGTTGLDRREILRGINLLIEKQHLLRSKMVVENGHYLFEEYAPPRLSRLPVIDLSGYREEDRAKALELIRDALRGDLMAGPRLGRLLYHFAVVKLDFANYRILMAYDHIIGDYDNARVLATHFAPLNGPRIGGRCPYGDYQPESPESFNQLIRLEPDEIAAFAASSDFRHYREAVRRLQQRFEMGAAIVFSNPKHLVYNLEEGGEGDSASNFLGLGLAVSVLVLASLFEIDEVPLRVLVNRRIFRGKSFYYTFGDFHDSLPVLFSARNPTPSDCFAVLEELDKRLSDAGFFMSSLGADEDIYRYVFKSPFNFNYVGEITPREERETLARVDIFSFVSYPVYSYRIGAKLGFVFFHGMTAACERALSDFLAHLPGTFESRDLDEVHPIGEMEPPLMKGGGSGC